MKIKILGKKNYYQGKIVSFVSFAYILEEEGEGYNLIIIRRGKRREFISKIDTNSILKYFKTEEMILIGEWDYINDKPRYYACED